MFMTSNTILEFFTPHHKIEIHFPQKIWVYHDPLPFCVDVLYGIPLFGKRTATLASHDAVKMRPIGNSSVSVRFVLTK